MKSDRERAAEKVRQARYSSGSITGSGPFVDRPRTKPEPITPLRGARAAALGGQSSETASGPPPRSIAEIPTGTPPIWPNVDLTEDTFASRFWQEPEDWTFDADYPALNGYAQHSPIEAVFLARAVDILAAASPDSNQAARRLWAAGKIVKRCESGDLDMYGRRDARWYPIGPTTLAAARDHGGLGLVFRRCDFPSGSERIQLFVAKPSLTRLVESLSGSARHGDARSEVRAVANANDAWKPGPSAIMAKWILNPATRAKAEASAAQQSFPAVARAFEALSERRWPANSIEATMRQSGQFPNLVRNRKPPIQNSGRLEKLSPPTTT